MFCLTQQFCMTRRKRKILISRYKKTINSSEHVNSSTILNKKPYHLPTLPPKHLPYTLEEYSTVFDRQIQHRAKMSRDYALENNP